MKKTCLVPVIMLALILSGCSKKDNTAVPVTPSTWNILGYSYKAATPANFSDSTLYVLDTATNSYSDISLEFGTVPAAGVYSIVSPTTDFVAPNQCAIQLIYDNGVTTNTIFSASGGNVTVTVTNKKINAVFNNVTMSKIVSHNVNTGYTFQAVGSASGNINE